METEVKCGFQGNPATAMVLICIIGYISTLFALRIGTRYINSKSAIQCGIFPKYVFTNDIKWHRKIPDLKLKFMAHRMKKTAKFNTYGNTLRELPHKQVNLL